MARRRARRSMAPLRRISALPTSRRSDGDPIQPGGERRVSAEGADTAKDLQESFLGKIFGFGDILGHQQANRVNTLPVSLEERGEGLLVSALGALNQSSF